VSTAELPYTNPLGTGVRPYLWVHLTGIDGMSGSFVGLLDTGADRTAMPLGYASLLGYGPSTLTPVTIGTASSPASAFEALQPCTAQATGLPTLSLSLQPVFVLGSSATVLWGRKDFMAAFKVLFDESTQQFTLSW